MKKILLISHSSKWGGAEKCLLEAAMGLKASGNEVHVVLPQQVDIYRGFIENGIAVTILPYYWWVHFESVKFNRLQLAKKLISQVRSIFRLYRIARKLKVDIILSNTICIAVGAITARLLGKKHYWFIHEFGKEDHGLVFDLKPAFSFRVMNRCSYRVFVNSASIFHSLTGKIEREKLRIIDIDVPAPELGSMKDNINAGEQLRELCIIGQVKPQKGQMDALQALHILHQRQLFFRLTIIGEGPAVYYKELKEFITANELDDYVSFLGHVSNPFECISKHSIGLNCSTMEALGRVTIEYMKAGIPVIATAAGENLSLVKENETGFLYKPKNPTMLADKIAFVSCQQEIIPSIIRQARTFSEQKFNLSNYIHLLMEGFES